MYIDIEDESLLQQYIVTGQNLAPNTEMKYIFRTDSKGNEYSNLIDFQSQRLIDLTVRRIDGTLAGDPIAFELIPINPAPDKYTCYIRNYVGKNVLSFGYHIKNILQKTGYQNTLQLVAEVVEKRLILPKY